MIISTTEIFDTTNKLLHTIEGIKMDVHRGDFITITIPHKKQINGYVMKVVHNYVDFDGYDNSHHANTYTLQVYIN